MADSQSFRFQYPILYARSSTGAVLTWEIEVEGNKYRTITGQENGAKITSKWSESEAKNPGKANATTAEAQALKDADSKWKKKLRSGGYWEDVRDIDKSRFVEPMLAHKLNEHPDKVKFPCMVDRKYNGGRVIAIKEGLYTRKGEEYATLPHIIESLKPLFDKYPKLVLDGEAYQHTLRFRLNEIMHIIRTTKNIDDALLKESRDKICLYVYDGYGFDNIVEDTGNYYRRQALKSLLKGVLHTIWVPFRVATNLEEVHAIYDDYVADGYEGAIIRNFDAPYQHKRCHDLLKVKPVDDDEFIIVDIIDPGSGNWGGTGKIINFKMKDGKTFKGTFKGSMEDGRQLLKERDKWIGKEVTVQYNGLTGLGTPNYAQLDLKNCFNHK